MGDLCRKHVRMESVASVSRLNGCPRAVSSGLGRQLLELVFGLTRRAPPLHGVGTFGNHPLSRACDKITCCPDSRPNSRLIGTRSVL